ncbi:MAG: phosphatidate cytidylyltransferase [Proteobacteria bacterium]|nr:MAG: phosphatidate cytidylyltransferase [Pseudomonadota bacterium]
MKTPLATRVISALVALGILVGLYYFFGALGLRFIVYFAVFVGAYELVQILIPKGTSKFHQGLFYLTAIAIFHMTANYPQDGLASFMLLILMFLVVGVLTHSKFKELDALLTYQAKSILGFVYVGLLPSYAYRIIGLQSGMVWFGTLLLIVFAGDIAAFASGVLFGKNKINPRLSPKKTWEGSIGGLLGSLLLGYACSFALPQVPLGSLLVTAICVGFVAQIGDFFESLMKRVANAKDSGMLMPGHGGVLDRLDGVLFASPIIMIVASLFESL